MTSRRHDPTAFVTHTNPAWRNRADFIIAGQLPEGDSPRRFEQLWAKRLDDGLFEICCIPFFLFDVALGDAVRTVVRGGRQFVIEEVVRPSGRYVFRVWFEHPSRAQDEIADALADRGCILEWSSSNLLAVDAHDNGLAREVASYLEPLEQTGSIAYETGRS
jgi:hypothetical protein